MPTPPEIRDAPGKGRSVKIFDKVHAHDARAADVNVSISGKIAVDLEGKKQRCNRNGDGSEVLRMAIDLIDIDGQAVSYHHLFEKSKGNALTSEDFADFIRKNEISEFYITGADAIACVKSTVFNMCKENYKVTVLSDCITSYDKRKIDEMLNYYEKNGSKIINK